MKKLLCNVIILICLFPAWGQQTTMQKHFDKKYAAKANGRLEISNKYGEVIVHASKSDSLRVKVDITADGRTEAIVQKNMNRISIRFREVGNLVLVGTEIARGGGLLGEILNEVDDYSKGLLGSNGMRVDYEVWLPEKYAINITHKFGDIFLGDLKGTINIDLAHGDIRGSKLVADLNLKQSFGSCNFDELSMASMTLRGVKVMVHEADNINVQSSSSEYTWGKIKSLQVNSRNDQWQIEEVAEMIGNATFSDFRVSYIEKNADMIFNYGDIHFDQVNQYFEHITIKGKSADIHMVLDQNAYILADITGEQDKMIVPNSMLMLKKEVPDQVNMVRLSGYVGNTQTTHSELKLQSEGGALVIAIKELPFFSDRK